MFIFTLAQQICALDIKGQIEKTELSQILSFHIIQLKFLPSELQKACITAHQECGFLSTHSQLVCVYKMVLILFHQPGMAYYPPLESSWIVRVLGRIQYCPMEFLKKFVRDFTLEGERSKCMTALRTLLGMRQIKIYVCLKYGSAKDCHF